MVFWYTSVQNSELLQSSFITKPHGEDGDNWTLYNLYFCIKHYFGINITTCFIYNWHSNGGSYTSAYVLLTLLNELGKID